MDNELGPTTALGEGPRKNKCINFPTKIKLNKSLAMSILLDGRESWTLTADLKTDGTGDAWHVIYGNGSKS